MTRDKSTGPAPMECEEMVSVCGDRDERALTFFSSLERSFDCLAEELAHLDTGNIIEGRRTRESLPDLTSSQTRLLSTGTRPFFSGRILFADFGALASPFIGGKKIDYSQCHLSTLLTRS